MVLLTPFKPPWKPFSQQTGILVFIPFGKSPTFSGSLVFVAYTVQLIMTLIKLD